MIFNEYVISMKRKKLLIKHLVMSIINKGIKIILTKKISALTDEEFSELLKVDFFNAMRFPLKETRKQDKDLLSTEEETIINHLSLDGLHGWGNMYNQLVASIKIPVTEDGETKYYSAGQFENKMNSEEDSCALYL